MRAFKPAAVWIVAFAMLSCDSYDGFSLELTTNPPADVSVHPSSITIPRGVAIGVRVLAPGAGDLETGETYVSLRSGNPAVVGVWPTVEANTFAVCGVSGGTAILDIFVDGQDDASVPVHIIIPGDLEGPTDGGTR